jgi:hypothetical protein
MNLKEPTYLVWDDRLTAADKNLVGDLNASLKEIKEDQHPIIIISVIDIVDLLRQNGKGGAAEVLIWLTEQFPKSV